MTSLVDLARVSREEQLEFLNSFDKILSDVDGVVAILFQPIAGAAECVQSLKNINKKISYVTNHGVTKIDIFQEKLRSLGIEVEQDDIFTPPKAIVWYLKKINFNRTIYVVGMPPLIEELTNAGFKVSQGPGIITPGLQPLLAILKDDTDVGAVLIENNVNLTYADLQKALVYLRRDDVLFLSGGLDVKIPISKDHAIIGLYYFVHAVEEVSGKKAQQFAKPSLFYKDFIMENLKIAEPRRTLFIGDAIREDMGFATKCGYQKLLVLSGNTKRSSLDKWNFPEEWKPKYYVDSLQSLNSIIQDLNIL